MVFGVILHVDGFLRSILDAIFISVSIFNCSFVLSQLNVKKLLRDAITLHPEDTEVPAIPILVELLHLKISEVNLAETLWLKSF